VCGRKNIPADDRFKGGYSTNPTHVRRLGQKRNGGLEKRYIMRPASEGEKASQKGVVGSGWQKLKNLGGGEREKDPSMGNLEE